MPSVSRKTRLGAGGNDGTTYRHRPILRTRRWSPGSHRHRTESWNSFRIKIPCKDNVYQPRVARNELPWVPSPTKSNPERVVSCDPPLLFSFRASDHVPPTRFEQPGHLNSGGPGKPKFRALGARHVSRPLGTCAVPRPLRQRIASLSGD